MILSQIRNLLSIFTLIILLSCNQQKEPQTDIPPNDVIPTPSQVAYQQLELIGFIHFTINTFTDKEWGFGDESPKLFNPSQMDVEQWARVAKDAGMKQLILTAKHHDGFCLWPSQYTEHSVKNSPYKNGEGDVVREFVDACKKYGLKAGLYLSPWDRNHPDYGTPDYLTYYRNQLEELLTQYGEINEIWFDGAQGGDGYYGGAYETRRINRKTYYDWPATIQMVKQWQPNIKIFSDAGPDVHWIGNEHGFAGKTFWSMINSDSLVIGASDVKYLNTGDPNGKDWIVGQCDVSIRPGWFYHESQDSLVKNHRQLLEIYYKSVGRNAILLLNLPPDQRGLIHENDTAWLQLFRAILDETFNNNLAENAICTQESGEKLKDFPAQNAVDGDPQTYWAATDTIFPQGLIIDLGEEKTFDLIMLQEPIWLGQRISSFKVWIDENGQWIELAEATTIGYKRMIKLILPKTSAKIKIDILEANNQPAISNIAVFREEIPGFYQTKYGIQ